MPHMTSLPNCNVWRHNWRKFAKNNFWVLFPKMTLGDSPKMLPIWVQVWDQPLFKCYHMTKSLNRSEFIKGDVGIHEPPNWFAFLNEGTEISGPLNRSQVESGRFLTHIGKSRKQNPKIQRPGRRSKWNWTVLRNVNGRSKWMKLDKKRKQVHDPRAWNWTVWRDLRKHHLLSLESSFISSDRKVFFVWTVHFWISGPSTWSLLGHLVSVVWTVQFNPHGPSFLTQDSPL